MKNYATAAIEAMGLDAFLSTYSIGAVRDDGLISLKYNQIESPMHEPCVADCRGLVVRDDDPTEIVAMAYRKFWNLGEKHADAIDWSTARVAEKLDGSLMTLYWHGGASGRWCVASSGHPTAGGNYNGADAKVFRDAFWETFRALGYREPAPGDRDYCFMFELCRPDNRIVVRYPEPRLVLHGARHLGDLTERGHDWLALIGGAYRWEVVSSWLPGEPTPAWVTASAAATDPLGLEGYVVCDAAFRRVKVKNPRYVEIHHLRGSRSPRSVVELWKSGEVNEVLAHFPEMTTDFDAVIDALYSRIYEASAAWIGARHAATRKDFALAVKSHPLSGALFRLHSDGHRGSQAAAEIEAHVRAMNTQAILRAVGAS